MKHKELQTAIDEADEWFLVASLQAVVELHKPLLFNGRFSSYYVCEICSDTYEYVGDSVEYPCSTIKAIEKELQ